MICESLSRPYQEAGWGGGGVSYKIDKEVQRMVSFGFPTAVLTFFVCNRVICKLFFRNMFP